MNIYLTKYKVKNVDIDDLDNNSFYECLFKNIVEIRKACRRIDNQIKHIAKVQYMPLMTTMEQYEAVIDLMNIKNELLKVYTSFVLWYEKLPNIYKKLYMACFVKRDHGLAERIFCHGYNSVEYHISKLTRDFRIHMKKKTKLDKETLIKYPFIHNLYVNTLIKNKIKGKKKGEYEHDCSANERRYLMCVRNRVVEEESK